MNLVLRSRASVLGALAAALALSACAAKHDTQNFTVGSVPASYKERHAIHIKERERTLDIPVGSETRALSGGVRAQIEGFAQTYAAQPNGPMRILLPSGSGNAHTASAVGADIVEALAEGGVPQHVVEIMHYDASRHGNAAPIRLSYHQVTAGLQHECGKWNRDLTDHAANRNYGNFGCATQKNLAAMVANPSDLLAPRGTTPVDAAHRARAIDAYRKGNSPNSNSALNPVAGEFNPN